MSHENTTHAKLPSRKDKGKLNCPMKTLHMLSLSHENTTHANFWYYEGELDSMSEVPGKALYMLNYM